MDLEMMQMEAMIASESGDVEKAIEIYDRLIPEAESLFFDNKIDDYRAFTAALAMRAQLYVKTDNNFAALDDLSSLIGTFNSFYKNNFSFFMGDFSNALCDRARVSYAMTEDFDSALEDIDRAIGLFTGEGGMGIGDLPSFGMALFAKGELCEKAGDMAGAFKNYVSVTSNMQNFAARNRDVARPALKALEALIPLVDELDEATLVEYENDIAALQADYAKCNELQGLLSKANAGLQEQKYQEAAGIFVDACGLLTELNDKGLVKSQGNVINGFMTTANLHVHIGRNDTALEYYDMLLAYAGDNYVDPESLQEVFTNKVMVLRNEGRDDEARSALDEGVKLLEERNMNAAAEALQELS